MRIIETIERIKNIHIRPGIEWEQIKANPTPPRILFINYLGPIILLSAIAKLYSKIHFDSFFSLVKGLVSGMIALVVPMLCAFVTALIINKIAESISHKKNLLLSFNLTIYSLTPFYVSLILANLISDLFFIGLAGLYGFVLLWIGSRVLYDIKDDRRVGFTIICGLIFITIYYSSLWIFSTIATRILLLN